MSYGAIRKKTQEAAPQEPDGPQRCEALGCPCIASVRVEGGRWCCTSHAFALPDLWPRVSEGLREHDWLLKFTADIQRMSRKNEDWRSFAMMFWHGMDDYCQPDPKEECIPYFNRMKGELDYRLGLCKRPAPRLPKERPAGRKFGNVAQSAAI